MARVLRMRGAAKSAPKKRPAGRPRSRRSRGSRPRTAGSAGRPFWKGQLAFGLVQIPVELHSAEARDELDFDLLDRRDLAPVGYLKVNKQTGEKVPKEEIVRGVKVSDDRHVVVTDEEIEDAAGEASRTVEIFEFVDRDAIPALYFERPIHLLPGRGAGKVHALLVRALADSGKVGLARVVLRARESIAAVLPHDRGLVLELLRWQHELRPPPAGAEPARAAAAPRELAMARRLIEEMSGEFRPAAFVDRYRKELLALVRRRARTGEPPPKSPSRRRPAAPANVVDLVALLEKSVSARRTAARPAARRRRSA